MIPLSYLPFDTGSFFLSGCELWKRNALANPTSEVLGDLIRVQTVVPFGTPLQHPFDILRFFRLESNPRLVGEQVWELVEAIRLQVFEEMLALTCEEYRLDWSATDKALCLWYRDRDCRRDASRDLTFVRQNTVALFSGAEITNSRIHGFGLFARKNFKSGQFLAQLDGQQFTYDAYEHLQFQMASALGRLRPYFFMEWNALTDEKILARPFRTYYSCINHSIEPNLELVTKADRVQLWTRCPVLDGAEFTLDYRKEPLPRGYFENRGSGYLQPRQPEHPDAQC